MSYILDALRKADAERRGVDAPVAQAEPAVLLETERDADDAPPLAARPWVWVLCGLGIALVGAGAFAWWRSTGPVTPAVAVAPVATTAPAPAVPEVPAPASPLPTAPAPSVDALPVFPPPLPEPVKPAAPPPPAPATAAAKPALPPGIAIVNPAPAPAVAAGERVYRLDELPEGVRRDFPKLAVSGAMYSERAADRMVVFNGQVFHEGDALGRDLKLRQIKLKSAVLEFRGYRVEIGY
jgi:general secretion pathway protein B